MGRKRQTNLTDIIIYTVFVIFFIRIAKSLGNVFNNSKKGDKKTEKNKKKAIARTHLL